VTPKPTVAIIGASNDPNKFGNKAVRAFLQQGFSVFPLNTKESIIDGLKCYKSIQEINETIDEVSLYVPPQLVAPLLEAIAKKNIKKVWFNPGTESDLALEKAEDLNLDFSVGCSILGIGVNPNSL
jgi:predicted CoA-binding protein